MGIFYGPKPNKIIIDKFPKFKNIGKRQLDVASDFSLEKMKQKAIDLFVNIYNINDNHLKIENLENAIDYDNTNEKILKEYLIILQKVDLSKYNEKINKYYYHISPENYKVISNKEKKFSAISLISELFEIFKNYDKNSINSRLNLRQYFYSSKIDTLSVNSTFNSKSNLELALVEIFLLLYKQINEAISDLWNKIEENQNDNYYLKKMIIPNQIWPIISSVISDVDGLSIKKSYLLINSYLFIIIFPFIKRYINQLDFVIKDCLKLKNIEKDYYMLLLIIIDLKYILYNKENKSRVLDTLTKYNDNFPKNYNIKKYNDHILINDTLKLKNYNIYYIGKIIENLENDVLIMPENKIMMSEYIKYEYFNENNYIKYFKKFLDQFNKEISHSKTIITLLNYLYEGFEDIKLFESEFTESLFKNAINSALYFPFYGKIASKTLKKSNKILFFISNRSSISESSLYIDGNLLFYLVNNLGIFIYIVFHEVLGHYLSSLLTKITEIDYKSPRNPVSNIRECDECIELLLFGQRFDKFSFKQLLFIMDINNYDQDFKDFKSQFQEITRGKRNYSPSNKLKDMLLEIDLDLNLIKNDKKSLANMYSEHNILENSFSKPIYLENCCDDDILYPNNDLMDACKQLINDFNNKK